MKYVITNVSLFDGTKDKDLQKKKNIYIEEDRIVKISDHEQATDGYTVIDGTGKYAVPGLINLHAHLFGSGVPSKILGGGKLQAYVIKAASTKIGQKVLLKVMENNAKMALYSGCTTVRSMGDFFYCDVLLKEAIEQGKTIGPRLYVSGPAITVPTGHGDGTFAQTGETSEELVKLVNQHHDKNVDVIKICITGGVMDAKPDGEPGELKMNLEQSRAVCKAAHELGYKVASHTEGVEGMKVAIEAGVDTIEHSSILKEALIPLCKDKNTSFVCTLSPALPLATFPSELTKLSETSVQHSKIVLENMIKGIETALAHNLPVGLGTDASCPFVTQYNMWREVYYFAKYLNVSNAFALHTATLKNAEILGIEKETGSIEEGKCADLLLLEKNPLESLTALRNVHTVIAKGEVHVLPPLVKNPKIEKELDRLL